MDTSGCFLSVFSALAFLAVIRVGSRVESAGKTSWDSGVTGCMKEPQGNEYAVRLCDWHDLSFSSLFHFVMVFVPAYFGRRLYARDRGSPLAAGLVGSVHSSSTYISSCCIQNVNAANIIARKNTNPKVLHLVTFKLPNDNFSTYMRLI